MTMWEDPIVAEVHRIREQLAAKFDYDIKAIFADMRQRQAALGSRLVSRKPKVVPSTQADRDPESSSSESNPTEAVPAA